MPEAGQTKYNPSFGESVQGISIDNNRRMFAFGERISELAPQQSPFFSYLTKVAKKSTNDPVFKSLEQRHQWQRRNFSVKGTLSAEGVLAEGAVTTVDMVFDCGYDDKGMVSAGQHCPFIIPGAVIAVKSTDGVLVYRIKDSDSGGMTVLTGEGASSVAGKIVHDTTAGDTTITAGDAMLIGSAKGADDDHADDAPGQVIGTAWAEGSKAPLGWEDALFDREGYCQIFKTAMNLFSGTSQATVYRGIANEYKRVWTEKLMEHKMDMEQAFLFGRGAPGGTEGVTGSSSEAAGIRRYTHGIVPYTEVNGKVYNMTYASSGYDAFLDAMEDFFAPESGNSGNKLVLSSRKVITYLNKIGNGGFLNNTVGSSQYRLDVQNIKGSFGHNVTVVNTIYGNLHFVAEPLFRGPWEDYCMAVDMKNLAYRPLVGNGISRDTFIETNIQDNDEDGRRDQIITEAGLEVTLPETHAVLKFS